MEMEVSRPRSLRCSLQKYDWGKLGKDSTVARFFSRNSEAEIEPEQPYAEFWIGTHKSGPSFLVRGESGIPDSEPVTLRKWILENPGFLGEKVVEKWGNELPFLFKVSFGCCDRCYRWRRLCRYKHTQIRNGRGYCTGCGRVYIYKDANHKPEMLIALTDFKALCGFVGIEELNDVLAGVPEIVELVGDEDASKVLNIKEQDGYMEVKSILRSIFTKVISASNDAVSELLSKLKCRLNRETKIRMLTQKEQLVLLLEKQYPADVGVISAFLFNYVKLSPGEALYIGANEPHAYISGDCIECMATSDNVVRAGLTPKYRDVQTLCSMLTYKQGFPEILQGTPLNHYISRYTPPFDEFEVDRCLLLPQESVVFPAIPGPSIFVVVDGEGRMRMGSAVDEEMVREGHVYFVPAHSEIGLTAALAVPLQLYRAGVNSRVL